MKLKIFISLLEYGFELFLAFVFSLYQCLHDAGKMLMLKMVLLD